MEKIKLKLQNGLDLSTFTEEVFAAVGLTEEFDFIASDKPDFIIFGPYGNDIPPIGNYIRIGYFCENMKPDLRICDWAFGIPEESEINNPKYRRIQWHGLDPNTLVKPANYDIERIINSKSHFCNFFYSHQVPYREAFFKQLNKYKKVDSPGKSMNNMPNIDSLYSGNNWEVKRQFLSKYKFTIAFENDVYPGYQTEKLYDPMQVNSIPIYCGDPYITKIFNTNSFLNIFDYTAKKENPAMVWIEKNTQMDFEDSQPSDFNSSRQRLKRFLKRKGREYKMSKLFSKKDFSNLINRIIELDKNPDLYAEYLSQPWFNNNTPPPNTSLKSHWIKIFNNPMQSSI